MKRALVLCDDTYHPAATARAGFKPIEQTGFQFEYCENGNEINSSLLNGFPLVILAKSNVVSKHDQRPWLDENSQNLFADHVQNGNGLLVLHSGIVGYKHLSAAQKIIGGSFVRHPPECAVTMTPQKDHVITRDIMPFTVHDEHYFVELEQPAPEVFLHSRSEHGMQPAGWSQETAGRVCVLTPGHNLEMWLHPSFQKILLAAMLWTSRINGA